MRGAWHRLRALLPAAFAFFTLETALRAALAVRASAPWHLLPRVFVVGWIFDVVVMAHLFLPAALYSLLVSERWLMRPAHRVVAVASAFACAFALLFDAVAEWLFWGEFASRFNFIAVDYLVYTREVLANIVESYAVAPIVAAIALASALLAIAQHRLPSGAPALRTRLTPRLAVAFLAAGLPLLAFAAVDARLAELSVRRDVGQVALNGLYAFASAFRSNQLDYDTFYRTVEPSAALRALRPLLSEPGARFRSDDLYDVSREVASDRPERRWNVVMIVVESLSAEYLRGFGGAKGLTPNLDALASSSLSFTRLYATGNRTVRGIEALTLSLPPTPGHSIVKRPHNTGLFSLGSLFRERGYETRFLYGGYGRFDDMNAFFAGNGFDVSDRASLSRNEVSFANAWGVADEVLLGHVLRQADRDAASGRPFLYFALTTSNHRPFTYPAGRIDLPSGLGRDGGVKYTDWAIGEFVRAARSRPWFPNTLFVVVADHCAGTSGRIDLPIEHYHIPMLFFAPALVTAGRVDTLASQMDFAPTLAGLLGLHYDSQFFGRDILRMRGDEGRALPATYERLGYWRGNELVVLGPRRAVSFERLSRDGWKNYPTAPPPDGARLLDEATAYYESASLLYARRR